MNASKYKIDYFNKTDKTVYFKDKIVSFLLQYMRTIM
jgi:hypothetical protein